MVYIHPKQCLALRIIAVNEWERCEQELWGNDVSVEVLKARIEKLEYERDTFRAENEKLRASMTAFMDAYYKQMRLQGWSDLDVFYNDD